MIDLFKIRARHIVTVATLSISLLAPLTSGAASGIDFKGIELGQTLWISQEAPVFGTLECDPVRGGAEENSAELQEMQQLMPGVRQVCTGVTSIAAVPADATVLLGANRRVLRMTFQFSGEDYPQVLSAMSAKWGEGIAVVYNENSESTWWDFEDGKSVSVHRTPANANPDSSDNPILIGLAEYSLPAKSPAADL